MVASRRTQIVLTVVFLAIIALGGTVQAVIELRHGERPQVLDLFAQTPTQPHLRAFEKELEKRAWPAVLSRPAMQYLRYRMHDDLGEKALSGQDGWLFYRPGVDFLMQPWPLPEPVAEIQDDPLPAIVAFRDALAERGIQLLVVPAPGKASAYPDRLSRRDVGPDHPVYDHARQFMERLDEAGVAYVDLFTLFSERRATEPKPLYLTQDTHWSPVGLQLASEAVAARVLAEGWIANGDTEYTAREAEIERSGDVLRMIDSPRITQSFAPEHIQCSQVLQDSGDGALTPYADDPKSPVLVLGDSFLRVFEADEPGSAGFIAHLAYDLGQPLASIVSDGGASTLVRQELQRKPELLEGKKLVIWEFVERDLRYGMEGWKIVSLPK